MVQLHAQLRKLRLRILLPLGQLNLRNLRILQLVLQLLQKAPVSPRILLMLEHSLRISQQRLHSSQIPPEQTLHCEIARTH